MVQIQLELSEKADAVVSYEKAIKKFKSKGEAVNFVLESYWEQLK